VGFDLRDKKEGEKFQEVKEKEGGVDKGKKTY
jgi:hypothetical protein